MLVFHQAFFEASVADGDAVRYANQFPVGKHGTGALATVVQDDVHASGQQVAVQLLGGGFDLGAAVGTDGADHHGERRQSVRPDDALGVMVLLDGRRWQTGDADAVAAHLEGFGFAVFVQKRGVHGLAVLGAEVKNMTHFNAALDGQHALAVG